MNVIDRPRLLRLAAATAELKKRQIKRECEGSLAAFVRHAWHVIEPAQDYVHGWHIDAIADHLEAVSNGDITRLLINVPPGAMKSTLVSVLWPAWEWGPRGESHRRIIGTSYSQALAIRDATRMRRLVTSQWYRSLWPDVVLTADQNAKLKFETTRTGFREAAPAGSLTGSRGDRLLLDDPHSVESANSDAMRQTTTEWFLEAVPTRLVNPKSSAIVVIMQRLHEADVSGIILEKGLDYEHLMIPMEYETGRHCVTSIGWEDPRTYEGELMFPARFPAEVVERDKAVMGPFAIAGQFQQRPEPRGGGILKRDYWRIWDCEAQRENDVKAGTFPVFEFVIASFDGAFTEKQENDFSALTVWGVWASRSGHPQVILCDAWQKRLTLHGSDPSPQRIGESAKDYELRKQDSWGVVEHIANTCRKNRIDKLLIESKATGITVAQEMRRLYAREPWTVQLIDPGRLDKVARAYSIQHLFADGMIWRPDTDWAQMVEDNCASFPRGAHDDLVDTTTMALNHLRKIGFALRRDEADAAEADRQYGRPRARVLYEA